jgi:hypothetical protein
LFNFEHYSQEHHTMKRFVVLSVAAVTFVLSASAATAAPAQSSTAPADYNPGCDQAYQSGKPIIDPLIQSPLKALFGPMEAAFCGEQKHVPS